MNTFTSVWSRNALFLMLLVILTGCTLPPVPRPFSCASFTESRWAVFRFGVDSPDDVVSTVARLWGIERDQVQFMLTISEEVYMARWRSSTIVGAGGAYEASFQEDQKLGKISVTWGNPRPRLYQIIDCLGFPDHYIAFFDPFEVTYLSWPSCMPIPESSSVITLSLGSPPANGICRRPGKRESPSTRHNSCTICAVLTRT